MRAHLSHFQRSVVVVVVVVGVEIIVSDMSGHAIYSQLFVSSLQVSRQAKCVCHIVHQTRRRRSAIAVVKLLLLTIISANCCCCCCCCCVSAGGRSCRALLRCCCCYCYCYYHDNSRLGPSAADTQSICIETRDNFGESVC